MIQLNVDERYNMLLPLLDSCTKHGLDCILLQLCLLWQMLLPDEMQLLRDRQSYVPEFETCTATTAGQQVVTFGILEEEWTMRSTDFCFGMERSNYAVGENEVLFFTDNFVVHVVELERRGHFRLIRKSSIMYRLAIVPNDSWIGAHDSAFDEVRTIKIRDREVSVPDDIGYFLFQVPHSRFIECRKDLAELHGTALKRRTRQRLKETIAVVRHLEKTL